LEGLRRGKVGIWLLAAACCLGPTVAGAASARAADWSERQLDADTSERLPLFGISCASPQLCV
jgi:hypothetical protein